MASSSPSALSFPSSSLSRNWEHNVFPSFHGLDVRKTFLSHVLKEFRSKGIDLFIDNEIKRGEFIGPELKRAIRGSKIAIVLLSKHYASSSWCLDELVEIMKKELGQKVITVFYEVDPTDVKKQTGDFGKAFKKSCRAKTKEKIKTWRKALEGVSTIAGYHSSNWVDEATMIENYAADISKMLNHLRPSRDFDHFIGMGAHMEKMELLLRLDLDEVRMIGIWGPSGIGKTSIARCLFNQVSNSFQNRAIMVNIKGSYPRPCLDEYDAQLQLQNKMLSQMINQKDIMIPHLGVAQGRLRDNKVFLVLDDVDRSAQLDALAKDVEWFGPGSRIIITTEDIKLLKARGIDHVYKVGFPSTNEALQMFCMYAFDEKFPKEGFEELAGEITYLVGELPLGLKVMGSYFRGLSEQEWSMEVPTLRTNLNGEIASILKFSYDALCDEDKDLFLHIACFFNHQYMEIVEEYLAGSFKNVRERLHVLAEKSLISISHGGFIEMHNLLAQLGKDIDGKRMFLDDGEDVSNVLTDNTLTTRSVIGVHSFHELYRTEKAVERMSNLQFLRVQRSPIKHQNIISSPGPLNYISLKLRLIDWSYFPMTRLPCNINMEFLVELRMPFSKLEKLWDGIQVLRNLKWMDLNFSADLKELPNLSTATNLKELNLWRCSSLVELPSSIGNATNLRKLNLRGCSSLVNLPSSIGNATNLKKLNLSGCASMVELPSSIGNATNLKKLNLSGCASLVELPSSIGNATNLKKVNFSGCTSLVELPSSIGNATNLEELYLSGCSSLVELPSSVGNLHELQVLELKRCSKLKALPIKINMKSLRELDLTDCWSLESFPEISVLYFIRRPLSTRSWLHLITLPPYSENLKEFSSIHNSMTELHLSDTGNQELGLWVRGFSCLRKLVLNGMQNLLSLPQLPNSLEELDAENCESLEKLDCSFCHPYIRLNFRNCFKLNQEARDLIIQSSTRAVGVLPGGEVPACFTYRASGSSVTVKPLRISTKFKACILLVNMDENEARDILFMSCSITSKQDARPVHIYRTYLNPILEHLYIFEVEAREVTSTELIFEFKLDRNYTLPNNWEIKECGILHLQEHHVDEDYESFRGGDEEICERRSSALTWRSLLCFCCSLPFFFMASSSL